MAIDSLPRRGLMLVLSSPSGAGKTTISRALLDRDKALSLSISATTRPKRPGEVSGRDYHFVDTAEFRHMIDQGELLEHAKVFDHYYGTPRAPVEQDLAKGRDVMFDIDWQGTQQLSQATPEDLVRVFILPPSADELRRRLERRAQDPQDVVMARMAKAADEISHWAEYDYVIVNRPDALEESVRQVQTILAAERLRRPRQTGLTEFVKGLRDEL